MLLDPRKRPVVMTENQSGGGGLLSTWTRTSYQPVAAVDGARDVAGWPISPAIDLWQVVRSDLDMSSESRLEGQLFIHAVVPNQRGLVALRPGSGWSVKEFVRRAA